MPGSKVQALVIGANGLVGRRVGELLTDKGLKWAGTCHKRTEGELIRLNITDAEEVGGVFNEYSPEAVFHCANLAGGVDFCEKNPGPAHDFHVNATKYLGLKCKDRNAVLVFISTDYVFDGTKGPYREDDATNPLNLYGRLKLEAEEWIRQNLKKYIIIRTTNVYGWDPKTVTPNYIMNLHSTLKDKRPFNAPSFLWGNPTYVGDLAEAMIELRENRANGVFHVVGKSFINRFDWAVTACDILGLERSLVKELKAPPDTMTPRPLKSWLNTDKFTASYKTALNDVATGLRLMKADSDLNP